MRRKIFISVITLVLLITVFTTSTYAWFRVNSSSYISGFNFEVMSGEGFLISTYDGNFRQELDALSLKQAMIKKYDNNNYYNYIDGSVIKKDTGMALTENEIDSILKETILLSPVTSRDGVVITDMYKGVNEPTSGKFIEFDLYFKQVSEYASDNLIYNIFLYLGDTYVDDLEGYTMVSSSLKSAPTDVTLAADMTLQDGTVLKAGDKVTVSSANAMRLSISEKTLKPVVEPEDPEGDGDDPVGPVIPDEGEEGEDNNDNLENPVEPVDETDGEGGDDEPVDPEAPEDEEVDENPYEELNPIIYEFYNSLDNGSYATSYDGDDDNLNWLYNSKTNAMFTYYNNQKAVGIEPLPFEELPQNVIRYDINSKEVREDVFTTVRSGAGYKLVTFRLWIEGWDADCFDGLFESINVKLSFKGKRIYENN